MSDRYWDVRSCRWQGGAVEAVPEWLPAPVPVDVPPAVPAQATSELSEVVVQSPAMHGGTAHA